MESSDRRAAAADPDTAGAPPASDSSSSASPGDYHHGSDDFFSQHSRNIPTKEPEAPPRPPMGIAPEAGGTSPDPPPESVALMPAAPLDLAGTGRDAAAGALADQAGELAIPVKLLEKIREDVECPVCMDVFISPVSLPCGHTFCRWCFKLNRAGVARCHLCRSVVHGGEYQPNVVLSALISRLGLARVEAQRPMSCGCSFDGKWWEETFLKDKVAVSLCLRLALRGVLPSKGKMLMDDLVNCVLHLYDTEKRWSKHRWVFTLGDLQSFCNLVGINKEEKEKSQERISWWVNEYILKNPDVIPSTQFPVVQFYIAEDGLHRVEANSYTSSYFAHRPPWDCGRHVSSIITVAHSSVSLFHLLFLPTKNPATPLAVVDIGSTIGTMIRIEGRRVLEDGDVIHLGDRVELRCVFISELPLESAYAQKRYFWSETDDNVVAVPVCVCVCETTCVRVCVYSD
eukprot:GHVU01070666.1.p1 GENE.GHVU01070666.1~~GHVU01070666.1.p1  ORF type:complete len:457 (+),score=94.54 GHVU01070666.1:223-1593(+)